MEIKDGYYVDSRDNRWDAVLYSAAQAEELSKSLIMCRFCTNCEFCNYCEGCTNCRNCSHCCDCKNCTEASFCRSCAFLHKASMQEYEVLGVGEPLVPCCLTQEQKTVIQLLLNTANPKDFGRWTTETVAVDRNGDYHLRIVDTGMPVECVKLLLALIDCATEETESDYFWDDTSEFVVSPMCGTYSKTLQEHLNMFLRLEKLPGLLD